MPRRPRPKASPSASRRPASPARRAPPTPTPIPIPSPPPSKSRIATRPSSKGKPTPRWSRDRDGKKRALLEAFDQLLQEEGAHRVGVNAVIKRAGVGKALLYQYFGGLDGLAAEWARQQDFLPGEAELAGGDPAAFARLSTREQLATNYQRYARALRSRPRTLEFLLAELQAQSDVLRSLEHVRTEYGKELTRFFIRPEDARREDVLALQVILFAAVNYLCLRSRTSPKYFHLRLDRESDWRRIDAMFALTVDRVLGRGSGRTRQRN